MAFQGPSLSSQTWPSGPNMEMIMTFTGWPRPLPLSLPELSEPCAKVDAHALNKNAAVTAARLNAGIRVTSRVTTRVTSRARLRVERRSKSSEERRIEFIWAAPEVEG